MKAKALQLRAPEEPRPRRDLAPPFNKLVGGWLCLDFVNTVAAWMPAVPGGAHGDDDRPLEERLTGYDALLHWAEQAGVLEAAGVAGLRATAARRPDDATAVATFAVRLRRALYRVFSAHIQSRKSPRDALEVLEQALERSHRGERLVEDEDGTVALVWAGDADELEAVLWPVIRSAVSLLSSRELLDRLRQCDGERCGWLFVDVSRGGRRRWCDMSACGNVAKVRAHRAKKRRKQKAKHGNATKKKTEGTRRDSGTRRAPRGRR